jgi:hypothetical protein
MKDKNVELNRTLQSEFCLTDPQLLFVQLTVKGYKVAECARLLSSGQFEDVVGPGYKITERALYKWMNLEQVQMALQACNKQKVQTLVKFEAERWRSVLPKVNDRLMSMVDDALDAFEDVVQRGGGRDGMARLKAAELILKYSGVLQMQTLQESERTVNPSQGLTAETAKQLREVMIGRVLRGDPTMRLVPTHQQSLEMDSPAEG